MPGFVIIIADCNRVRDKQQIRHNHNIVIIQLFNEVLTIQTTDNANFRYTYGETTNKQIRREQSRRQNRGKPIQFKISRTRSSVAERVPGGRLPLFRDIRHIKVVRLPASNTGRLYRQEMLLVLISVRGCVDPRAIVRSEGNAVKNPVTPPGIDPGKVRLVAQHLNHYATPGPD
jgi:hypothetical protein